MNRFEGPPGDLPGEPMTRSELFEPKMAGDEEVGVRDPDGEYFKFQKGESFVRLRLEDAKDREPYIKLTDGTLVPFDVWAEQERQGKDQK